MQKETFIQVLFKIVYDIDIAFIIKLIKWAEKEGDGIEERLTQKGWITVFVAIVVFSCTILYQMVSFLRLLFTSPTDTFCPLTSHTTRLLMCSDYRFLGMSVDKFSVSFYEKIFRWRIPTFKILAIFKLIFEDWAQASIQIIYLLFISNPANNKSSKIKDGNVIKHQISLVIIIGISLAFAIPSIISSIMTIIYNTTSSLKQSDYQEMVNSKFLF